MLRPRFVKVWLRRWREVIDTAQLLMRIVFKRGGDDPLARFVPKIDSSEG